MTILLLQQLLNTGCTEHVDFATSEDASVAEDAFEELGGKTSQMISRTSLRDVVEEDVTSREVSGLFKPYCRLMKER